MALSNEQEVALPHGTVKGTSQRLNDFVWPETRPASQAIDSWNILVESEKRPDVSPLPTWVVQTVAIPRLLL